MKSDNRVDAVIQSLREAIAAANPEGRLPSVRALIAEHRVGPATVERAFAQLVGEGLIEPRPGRGTFVRPTRGKEAGNGTPDLSWQSVALGAARSVAGPLRSLLALPPPDSLILSTGYLPPDLQATTLLITALRQAAGKTELWDRLPVDGLEALRAWFARETGPAFSAHDVVICGGGQAAIATTFRALVPPGGPILLEMPTYTGAISAARASGLELVPVAMDEDGVLPELLADAFRRTGARVFYSQPTFSNPSGTVLSPERRQAVLDIATAARAFVVEDDWARDLDLTGTAPAPLAAMDRHGHVVHIRSLAKSAAPGLRVSAIVARGAVAARLKAARSSDDFFVSGPLQAAALATISAPGWKRHLQATRAALIERRDALVHALRAELRDYATFRVPQGGMHVWLRLPDHVSDGDISDEMARQGVVVSPGSAWFPADPDGSFLRLTFASAPTVLSEGVRRLGTIVRQRA